MTWEEGKCLFFDDSYEHEVWNEGGGPRVVLLFDIFNPLLPEKERKKMLQERKPQEDLFKAFMEEHGIRRVEMGGEDGTISISLDSLSERVMRHYMTGNDVRKAELKEGKLALERISELVS